MQLPVVDVFKNPYEVWSTRGSTDQEMAEAHARGDCIPFYVNDKCEQTIRTHLDAAKRLAITGMDSDLENHIDRQLDEDENYKYWRQCMPSKTPPALTKFQQHYPNYNQAQVDVSINLIGHTLSNDQYLFHGGLWPDKRSDSIKLERPLSTTFCPQVALRNAEWRAKAYDAGEIDLFVLRVHKPKIRVFAYKRKGTSMGNEKEVLFASGATIRLQKRILIDGNYSVFKVKHPPKTVPIYVIEVDVS
jgi:hypothetical protein